MSPLYLPPASAGVGATVETLEITDDAVTSAKLSAALRASMGKANTAVQPGDLGDAATLDVGTTSGTVAAGAHVAQHATGGADPITPVAIGAAAAADLGTAAALDVGTTIGTVAAGDDSRIVAGGTSLQPDAAAAAFVQHVGTPSGVDDTTTIQAALTAARVAGGGEVIGRPGATYQISAPLEIGSGVTLRLHDLTLIEGSDCQMIRNYSDVHPVATASDAATTSGSNVVTTSLGASAEVGMTAYITGAGSNGEGELVGIVSACDATTITLVKLHGPPANASATVTGAAIQLSNMDTDVHVEINVAHRGANGPDTGVARGSAITGHSIFLRGVDRYSVTIREAYSTAGVSFIWPCNAAHGEVRLYNCDVHRTGVQPVGPIYDLRLYVRGKCTDDLVNLCGNVYKEQTNTSGDVIGVTIEDIVRLGTTAASTLKINPCVGNVVDGVTVLGRIGGSLATGTYPAVFLMEDTARPETTGGTVGSVNLGTLDFPVTPGPVLGLGPVACRSVTAHVIGRSVHPVSINPGDAVTSPPLLEYVDLGIDYTGDVGDGIQVKNYANVGTLKLRVRSFAPSADRSLIRVNSANARIRHLLLDAPQVTLGRNTTVGLVRLTAGTVDRVTFQEPNITWYSTTNGNSCVLLEGAAVGVIAFRGGEVASGDTLVRANSGSLVAVRYDGVRHSGGQRLLHSGLSTTVYLDSMRRSECTQIALYPQSAAVALTIRGSGAKAAGANATGNTFIDTNGVASVPYSLGFEVDVSKVGLAANAMAWNANGALACGVGPVICNGTSWKHLYTGAVHPEA